MAHSLGDRPVFLIGYRGSGKTTVARLLAERLGWDWLDADAVVEARHGKTVRQIFADEGEAGFRDKEAALLEDFCRLQRHVIAAGGGIVLRPENREKLRQGGTVVWLTAGPATLWDRIRQDVSSPERRPDLTVGGLAEIEELMQVRALLYRECAQLTVSSEGCTPADVAEMILKWIAVSG